MINADDEKEKKKKNIGEEKGIKKKRVEGGREKKSGTQGRATPPSADVSRSPRADVPQFYRVSAQAD